MTEEQHCEVFRMPARSAPDLRSLARAAQRPSDELKPLLLRIHTQLFIAAPGREPDAVASYESIALGLIPLVTDDVLAETAAALRDCAETPAAVRDALAARLGDAAIRRVDRGCWQSAEACGPNRFPAATPGERDAVLRLARAGEREPALTAIAAILELPGGGLDRLDGSLDPELLTLALRAIGLSAPNCMRALHGLMGAEVGGDGFRLALLARATPPEAAAALARSAALAPGASRSRGVRADHGETVRRGQVAAGGLRPDGRMDVVARASVSRAAPWAAASARADHRSRPTTGPGRS